MGHGLEWEEEVVCCGGPDQGVSHPHLHQSVLHGHIPLAYHPLSNLPATEGDKTHPLLKLGPQVDHQAKLREGVNDGDSQLVLHPWLHVGHYEAIERQENLIVFHSIDWSWLLHQSWL